jgi:hypothetical protein
LTDVKRDKNYFKLGIGLITINISKTKEIVIIKFIEKDCRRQRCRMCPSAPTPLGEKF